MLSFPTLDIFLKAAIESAKAKKLLIALICYLIVVQVGDKSKHVYLNSTETRYFR